MQYAVLFQLRELKHNAGVDDSDYIHVLHYVELGLDNIADITSDELARLKYVRTGFSYLLRKRAVPPSTMRKALGAEQHFEYVRSFEMDISHVESDGGLGEMPWQLRDYMDLIRKGDYYTRISNLFKNKQRIKHPNGKTAFSKYDTLAEGFYEDAIMDLCNYLETDPLRNTNPSLDLVNAITRWLDREVDTRDGFAPDISQAGVPRVKGSKSRFSQCKSIPVVGEKLRKYWRQRNALVAAALPLIYAEKELNDEEIEKMMEEKERTKIKLQHLMDLIRND